MLKGIPEILSPELLKVLCEMGHSDRLVIADGNFPVESMGKNAITIRCDGHGVPEILDAILKLFPLDTYVEHPVNLMEVNASERCCNQQLILLYLFITVHSNVAKIHSRLPAAMEF